MTNAIQQFKFQPPTAFGTSEEINAIIERMEALVPVTLSDKQKANPVTVQRLNNAYLKTAQLSVFYKLVPGVDVHILPFGDSFAVDMGIHTWKKAADRYCGLHGLTFHPVFEELNQEELKRRRGDRYDPEDVGYVCYIWRSDKAAVYQMFGGKEAVTKGYGHWAKKGIWNKFDKKWEPDTIPAQRTKHDVARRRAMKAGLMGEFSLDSLLAATPNEMAEQLKWLDISARRAVEDSTPMQRATVHITEEGLVVEDSESDENVADGSWHDDVDFMGDISDDEAEEGSYYDPEPPAEEEETFENDPEVVAEYRMLGEKLTDSAATLRDWCKTHHADSDGPSSLVEYRILSGELDKLVGSHNHNVLLGVLLGREVHSSNRPGEKLVRYLLHFIQKQKTVLDANGKSVKDEKGKVVKVENSGYREQFVEALKETWKQINVGDSKPVENPQDSFPF